MRMALAGLLVLCLAGAGFAERFHAHPPQVGPQDQILLSELWTGMRLQGGLPVLLTPAEHESRRQRWSRLGGGVWQTRPFDLPQASAGSQWNVAWSGAALALLGALLWLARYGWPGRPRPARPL